MASALWAWFSWPAEGVFQLSPESLVFSGKLADACVGDFEAAEQRGLGGALRCRQWCAVVGVLEIAKSSDLIADVILGVESQDRAV